MGKSSTSSFVLTLPLEYNAAQKYELDKIFRIASHIYNSLMSDRLKVLQQIERTQEWKANQAKIAEYCQERKNLLAEYKNTPAEEKEELLETLKAKYQFYLDKKQDIFIANDMTNYGFQKVVKKYTKYYKSIINSIVGQKIAIDVWSSFSDLLYSKGKTVHFKPWTEFYKIEGKNNTTGIVFRDDNLILNNKLRIPVVVDINDEYKVKALTNRIKYCRVIRKWNKTGWYYQLQLILEGIPPTKSKYSIGKGRVGIDIGTQTVAVVSESDAMLVELADRVKNINKELRIINRAMDRSRRANNPEFFDNEGKVIPRNKLPKELLTKRGKRKWNISNNYKKLSAKRHYLYAVQAETRRLQHKTLANKLLTLGDEFYIEDMNFKSLAVRSKETKQNENGKNLSKKRFGSSIANKAPALFVTILSDKVTSNGGTFTKIKTQKAKASRYNHLNQEYNKKKLSERWNDMPDGRKIQRDLYSAFLIMNISDNLESFDNKRIDITYVNFCINHDKEIARLKGIKTPLSTGVR